MHSLDNQYMNTHSTLQPNLIHKHHVDHGQVASKQDPVHAITSDSQNDTHILPKSCSPRYINQALPYLHYTNSARLNPSLDSIYTYAINSKGADYSCSYGVKLKKDDTNMGLNSSNIQEVNISPNSYIIIKEEENILSQSLHPNNNTLYASNIKEIDDNMQSFTSCSYNHGVLQVNKEDDSNMGFNSSNINIQEEKQRETNNYVKTEDTLSSQFCRAGSFDVSTPTKQESDASKDGNILNFSSVLSNPKSDQVSMESLMNANPITASTCKASKSPRKKKTDQKQIICVPLESGSNNKSPGECLHSDSWAWRKYGQKPIKGSPYPRGYYRCSSCKGCTARKQVERSRSDPSMLVITYTSGHNHTWQAIRKNPQKLEATLHENPKSIDPHENIDSSIHGSMQHCDNNHVKTLSTPDSPYNSMLEGYSPCIRGNYDIGNLQNEGPQNELDYFGLLEELSGNTSLTILESTKSPLSEHEDPITIVHSNVVDPFNLFNWSSNIGLNYYSPT